MNKEYRYYQQECDDAIYDDLIINNNNKCIVKMFCGTGKSLVMRKCMTIQNKQLVVYVFPSLSLIDQFYIEYLFDFPDNQILKISSANELIDEETTSINKSTTNILDIQSFLTNTFNKIICITYQSYETLLDNLGDNKIDVCLFDEAHHCVGKIYQTLIFQQEACEKQIFFTATPKNENGITMYDYNNLPANMCGKLVYEFNYLRGLNEGYLNPFEIEIDMYTENTNKSIYETIARAILTSGNNRVLTFHSDVNTDRNTSVINFVDIKLFIQIFVSLMKNEFPDKLTYYKKAPTMIAFHGDIKIKERREQLKLFDETPNNEIFIISSCETIGEGIDTKNANMCVFADPKSSYVKIIQNIGRIVRKLEGIDKPKSTILIPCWVDKEKYLGCNGDKEKCDEAIRQDMNETGNFNGILNVLSALKQDDEELYDICIHYPNNYSPQEIYSNLEKQGYTIDETIEPDYCSTILEHLLETDIDIEDYEDETDEEMIMRISEENDVCIEIHTNSLECPVEKYNSDNNEVIRLYKTIDEDTEETIYQPIVKKETNKKRNNDVIRVPNRNNRLSLKVHTNKDIKVLWNIVSDFDITKDVCSCIIDCEIVKYDPMEKAIEIVERANERVRNGLKLLPRQIHNIQHRNIPELKQEHKDATKLGYWKKALKGKGSGKCSDEVRNYLDLHLLGWRDEQKAMNYAIDIVSRANERVRNGLKLLPRSIKKNRITAELEQEYKDATKLGGWKNAL